MYSHVISLNQEGIITLTKPKYRLLAPVHSTGSPLPAMTSGISRDGLQDLNVRILVLACNVQTMRPSNKLRRVFIEVSVQ